MNEFTYTVVVSAETKEQADQVIRERLDHPDKDENYGFDYRLLIKDFIRESDLPFSRDR